jgi:hypothetical protein
MNNRYELPSELLDTCRMIEQLAQVRGMSHEAAAVAVLTHTLGDLIASGWKLADSMESIEQTLSEAGSVRA